MLNRAYQRGVTLIELIITISVLGALLLFAAPNFSQIMKSS
ncbi:pilus assembly FimT family protein [Vibrio parahaemolyticus]